MSIKKTQCCKRCLYTADHPLGLTFDDEGICSGCYIHEEKDILDWNKRFQKLQTIIQPYKSKSGKNYDCIVPVSGGVDSYFIVYVVKNMLGLNPLLVTYNKYWNTSLGIRNLANLRIKFNCDILIQNVNPLSVKKIVRTTLTGFGSIYWHCIAGQTVFPVQVAVSHQIPLIIWGAHQGVEQSGMFSHEHEVEMTRRYRKDHDLMGREADDLLSIFGVLSEEDIWQYRYPSDTILNEIGVRGVYLNNYVRWDPKAQHEQMISQFDYKSNQFNRTFDTYDYVECFNYMNIHDVLKLYKHGYSKVTDHVCREIRHKRFNREDGLALIRKYEQAKPKYVKQFCDWLGIEPHSLQFVMDQHRNPKYWQEVSHRKWEFNGISHQYFDSNNNQSIIEPDFNWSELPEPESSSSYITIGKGYP